MTENEKSDVQVRRISLSSALGGLTVVLGTCVLSTAGSAAGPSNRTHVPELRTFLASADALSEAAMARHAGMGLHPPGIITNDPDAGRRVQLWDELKFAPLTAPVMSGMTTGGNTAK